MLDKISFCFFVMSSQVSLTRGQIVKSMEKADWAAADVPKESLITVEGSTLSLACSNSAGWQLCSWRLEDDVHWCHSLVTSSSGFCDWNPRIEFQKTDGFVCTIEVHGVQYTDAGNWTCNLNEDVMNPDSTQNYVSVSVEVISPFTASISTDWDDGEMRCESRGRGSILPNLTWTLNSKQIDALVPESIEIEEDSTVIRSSLNITQFNEGSELRCEVYQINPVNGEVVFQSSDFALVKFDSSDEPETMYLSTENIIIIICSAVGVVLILLAFFIIRRRISPCFGTSGVYKVEENETLVPASTEVSLSARRDDQSNLIDVTKVGEDRFVRLVKINTASPLVIHRGAVSSDPLVPRSLGSCPDQQQRRPKQLLQSAQSEPRINPIQLLQPEQLPPARFRCNSCGTIRQHFLKTTESDNKDGAVNMTVKPAARDAEAEKVLIDPNIEEASKNDDASEDDEHSSQQDIDSPSFPIEDEGESYSDQMKILTVKETHF